MSIIKKLAIALSCVLLSSSLAFAATTKKTDCPKTVLSTGTVEGVILEEFCEDGYCHVTLKLPNGKKFEFGADYTNGSWEGYATERDQKLSIQYQVDQYWSDETNKCYRNNMLISSTAIGK